jgi:hypothetical protein
MLNFQECLILSLSLAGKTEQLRNKILGPKKERYLKNRAERIIQHLETLEFKKQPFSAPGIEIPGPRRVTKFSGNKYQK